MVAYFWFPFKATQKGYPQKDTLISPTKNKFSIRFALAVRLSATEKNVTEGWGQHSF